MSAIINGDSPSITFSDGTTQATSAIVSGKVPYTNLPTGSVLQVVNTTYSTQTSNNTTTFADTGLTVSITPKFSTSKILVLVSINGVLKFSGSAETGCGLRLIRASTTIVSNWSLYLGYTGSSTFNAVSSSFNYLDSPATTSSTAYKVQFASTVAGQEVDVQRDGATSSITLMEIAG